MINIAKVVEVADGYAIVETERKSACDGCHKNVEGQECSVCTLMGKNRKAQAKAINKVGACVGDKVEIVSNSSRILFYGLIVFILPIVCGIVAYFVAQQLGATDPVLYISVAGGFILPFIPIWIYSSKVVSKRCDIVIKRII